MTIKKKKKLNQFYVNVTIFSLFSIVSKTSGNFLFKPLKSTEYIYFFSRKLLQIIFYEPTILVANRKNTHHCINNTFSLRSELKQKKNVKNRTENHKTISYFDFDFKHWMKSRSYHRVASSLSTLSIVSS